MSGNIIVPSNIIEVRKGDTFVINFQINKGCSGVDLEGSTISMCARNKATNAVVLDKQAVGVDMAKGKMALVIEPKDTQNITVGDYVCVIKIAFSDGNIHTIFPEDVKKVGIFRVTPSV